MTYICSECGEVESNAPGVCPLCNGIFKRKDPNYTKRYLISEECLLELLEAENTLRCLEWDGVDNWSWYMESRRRYIADALGISEQDVRENDLDFIDVAKAELANFQQFD